MEESDKYNNETFGDMDEGPPPGLSLQGDGNLPSFFAANSGVTILDELAGMSLTEKELEKDDMDDMMNVEAFNTDEGDDFTMDEKLPDFFSNEKLYDDVVTDMRIGRKESEQPSAFPLPTGAQVVDPATLGNNNSQLPNQERAHDNQDQRGQQQQQQPSQMHPPPNFPQMLPPPPQVLLCPPGALPPAQSISALSTPGQKPAWHQQQQFHAKQFHRMSNSPRYPPNTQRLQVPSMNTAPHMVAAGLSPIPSGPPSSSSPTMTPSNQTAGSDSIENNPVRRGPPAVKGGAVPPPTSNPPVPIASGLSGQGTAPMSFPPRPMVFPNQQFRHVPQTLTKPRLNCGSKMSHSDVRFVVGKVLQTAESHDPYNDDFYYIQWSMRRHGRKVDKAINENKPLPPPLPIPLPTWTETKKRIHAQLEESRQHYEDRSRKWELQEKVLGHNVKSDVSKPRAVLSVPVMNVHSGSISTESEKSDGKGKSLDDMISGLEDMREDGVQPTCTPFTSVLWNMRGAVHRGYGALYVAQELRQLLNTPLVNAPNNATLRADIIQEATSAVAMVCKSVGLKEAPDEITASTDFLTRIQSNATTGVLLDGGLVAALLQTTKGKKLMRRSICLLQASQRWTLLPVLVTRILKRDPAEQSKEDVAVEATLLATIIDFIQYEEGCIINGAGNNIPPAVLLVHLRQCIKSVMVSQMETKQLRKALVSSRKRAEVMHIILRLGDQIVATFYKEDMNDEEIEARQISLQYIDKQRKMEWTQLRDAFMLMLEN